MQTTKIIRVLIAGFVLIFAQGCMGDTEHMSIASLRMRAAQGDAAAQVELGELYYRGEKVKKDYKRSAYWYHEAAKQGYAAGEHAMGWMYHQGRGVAKNSKDAVRFYRRAAAQGDQNAKQWLQDNGY